MELKLYTSDGEKPVDISFFKKEKSIWRFLPTSEGVAVYYRAPNKDYDGDFFGNVKPVYPTKEKIQRLHGAL